MDDTNRTDDSLIDGIDYEEIHRLSQADEEAGRIAFNSADYATDEEAEAAPILEIVVPAGRDDQRQDGKDSQQKDDSNFRYLFHDSGPKLLRRAK